MIKTAKSTSKPTIPKIEHDVALGRADAFVMDRLSALELIEKTGLPLQLAVHRLKLSKTRGHL